MNSVAKFGVVTVSDRASRGEYEDLGGPAVLQYLSGVVSTEFETVSKIISDDVGLIEQTLIELADQHECCLLYTSPSPRDRG